MTGPADLWDEAAPRERAVAVGAVAVAMVVLAALVARGCSPEGSVPGPPGTGPATVPPTSATPPVPVWPLTGLLGDPAAIGRPAAAVKVDNSPQARPQAGFNQADLVYELQVEGITRFMEVYHSQAPDRVGPVRSVRSSDFDLLFGLGRPLLVWSGANPGVVGGVRAAEAAQGLTDAGVSSAAGRHYSRDGSRAAPHNLYANIRAIRDELGAEPTGWPGPILPHAPAGQLPPGATPAAGVRIDFGLGVVVHYVWDAERKGWDRFQADRSHPRGASAVVDEAGVQVAPENVVVLFLPYAPDPIDARSPKAQSVGGGDGLALMGGTSVAVRWRRDNNRDIWNLTDATTGAPVLLGAGRAWVALPAAGGGRASILDGGEAAALLATRV